MAKQARAVETRAAIIRGAALAFEARGYGSTSLSDVTAAAGVTKGALYFHFDSKETLAIAIISAQHEASSAIGRKLLDERVPGLRAIVIMSIELARQIHEDPVVRAGLRLTLEAANFNAPIARPYLDWMGACEEFLRRGIADGDVVESTDVTAVAHFIIPAFTGVQTVSDVLTKRQDILQRLIEMWAVVLPGLVPVDRWHDLKSLPEQIRLEFSAR